MKKFLLPAAALSMIAISSPAMAHPVFSGTVTVQKGTGPVLTCDFVLHINDETQGGNTTIVLTDVPSGVGCTSVKFVPNTLKWSSYPTNDYVDDNTDFTVSGIFADTTITPGDCYGNLTATNIGTGIWSISGSLPQVSAGGACAVNGLIS